MLVKNISLLKKHYSIYKTRRRMKILTFLREQSSCDTAASTTLRGISLSPIMVYFTSSSRLAQFTSCSLFNIQSRDTKLQTENRSFISDRYSSISLLRSIKAAESLSVLNDLGFGESCKLQPDTNPKKTYIK